MQGKLELLDIGVLGLYCLVLVGMGIYYRRKCRTSEQFMVADRTIPAWAAGLAVMSAYTSSISYIATPGVAYDSNWHPLIFSLCIIPVAWLACRYAVGYYRRKNLISVYSFLEERLGAWGRLYAALSFLLYMIGRVAVILYLVSLLLSTFLESSGMETVATVIVVIGLVTIVYTLLGGMEAVIWTDVMQSIVMIVGILFCTVALSRRVWSGAEPLMDIALEQSKFSLGSLAASFDAPKTLANRTILVMIIFGITENLRNLLADQNYVQKYCSVPTEARAKKSVWIAMAIYIPLTAIFLYIGTALFALYNAQGGLDLPETVVKGDQVFPHYIATQVPEGLRGLIVAAIVAAAMSTVDSALNCSATVWLLDFHKRYINPDMTERQSIGLLRGATVVYGLVGTGFAVLMIRAESALNVWWQISGIFGGGMLGLFILSLLKIRLRLWQGLAAIGSSIAVIAWCTFARSSFKPFELYAPGWMKRLECTLDPIIIGATGTAALMLVAIVLSRFNPKKLQSIQGD